MYEVRMTDERPQRHRYWLRICDRPCSKPRECKNEDLTKTERALAVRSGFMVRDASSCHSAPQIVNEGRLQTAPQKASQAA